MTEEEKDKGVEMSQDFDGEMFDVPEVRVCVRAYVCGCVGVWGGVGVGGCVARRPLAFLVF